MSADRDAPGDGASAAPDCLACEAHEAIAIAIEDWTRRHGQPHALDALQAVAHVAGAIMGQFIAGNPAEQATALRLAQRRMSAGIRSGTLAGSGGALAVIEENVARGGETLQ
jgi:hypothetical protein